VGQDISPPLECIKAGNLQAARSGLPAQTSPGQATLADLSPSSLPIVNLIRQTASKQDVSGHLFVFEDTAGDLLVSPIVSLSGISFYGVVRQAQTLIAWDGNGTGIFPILRLASGHFEQRNTLLPAKLHNR
jgi:hypothetical protein